MSAECRVHALQLSSQLRGDNKLPAANGKILSKYENGYFSADKDPCHFFPSNNNRNQSVRRTIECQVGVAPLCLNSIRLAEGIGFHYRIDPSVDMYLSHF